jgi:cephalosporin-C deacetylase
VFAAYNQYGAAAGPPPDTTMHVYPFNHHEGGEAFQVRRQLDWLSAQLAAQPAIA